MYTRSQIIAALRDETATPLISSASLAQRLGVSHLSIKVECARPLGNFKVLGGLPAGLNALARATGLPVAQLIDEGAVHSDLPTLICASDGNHGLSVAAAALAAKSHAIIVLHEGVHQSRIARIRAMGAEVVIARGNYDDSVRHAEALADANGAILIADTSDEQDPVVQDVMNGYARISDEIEAELAQGAHPSPSHVFVQAGVGGLAAAMAQQLTRHMREPGYTVVVEPEAAACVTHALRCGRIEPVEGDLDTSATMLACGTASAPAMAILWRYPVRCQTVSEEDLASAVQLLERETGLRSTPSGSAGLAGLLAATSTAESRSALALNESSTPLIIVTEGAIAG
jgi:diaminopropionate ammonia-lyase